MHLFITLETVPKFSSVFAAFIFRPGRGQTPVINQTLQLTQELHKTKSSLMWAIINGVLLAIVLYDV